VDLTLRQLQPADADAFIGLDDAAFSVRSTPEQRAQALSTTDWSRMLGAFGGDGVLCGVTGSYDQRLTLPGGGRLAVAGVTAVGVLPTHRRRGVLSSLMARQLDDLAASGCSVAVLTASEATIYRRFGYGVASRHHSVRIERARSAFADPVPADWTLRLVDDDEAQELAPPRFEAALAGRVGALTRPTGFWSAIFGPTETWVGGGEHFTVLCDPPAGSAAPGGYATYKVRREGTSGHWVTQVGEVVAADPGAEAVLWRYLLDIDLTEALEIGAAPLDDALAWRLADWRAYQVQSQADLLWVRLLDPVAALSARAYGSADELVVEVADRLRPAQAGRYRLVSPAAASPGTAQVSLTDRPADLELDVADLGSLYLGGVSASTLIRGGRIRARDADVAARADRLFAAEHQPFCLTRF
jgi:predicted acetyltransferase